MSRVETLCPASEIPEGGIRRFQVGDDAIAIVCLDGQFFALSDVCTHLGCRLSEGVLEGTTIVCPCHGSIFDIRSGAVMGGPAIDPLQSYPVAIEAGQVQISL